MSPFSVFPVADQSPEVRQGPLSGSPVISVKAIVPSLGFDVEAALSLPPGKRRLGLFGMQERARRVGGTFTIESEPGKGTTIFLRLRLTPLTPQES